MGNILKLIETPYVDAQTLLTFLHGYKKPREAILRMVKNGELIRLKNGIYLISEKIEHGIPYEQVANFLYGPSYVSMEWALSFYGMIPERINTVTSMTLGRNKDYHTSIADFSYLTLPADAFPIGVTQKKTPDFLGNFLIASREKALSDMVFKQCQTFKRDQLRDELIESRRMDPESLMHLDIELLKEIGRAYHSKIIYNLIDLIGLL